jgi:RNA polymerase sigma-70 factor (ECF subfamily)
MHDNEDRPTSEQLNSSWDETLARLRSFIAARVGDDDVAADIAQDVLVRSIAAGALERVDNPTAWLYRSARNAVIDHYRTRHAHEPLGEIDNLWPEPEPVDHRPNDATRDLAACLQPLVARLPDIYQEALERVDLTGQSNHIAAAELGISTSGMKSRVQRARHQLKELLTDCCTVQLDQHGAIASYQPNTSTCACRSATKSSTPQEC